MAAAKPHLGNMLTVHKRLSAYKKMNSLIVPVPIEQLSDGGVRFPYIDGKGVERLLVTHILNNETDDALAIIDKLLAIIDTLPVKNLNPNDNPKFVEVFGTSYNVKQECVTPGIIDLNLDNIIEDQKGQWHLIDYEWTFDFPVPKALIVQRFFYWFFVQRYQGILQYHATRIEQLRIGPAVCVPAYTYKKYGWAFKDFDKVVHAESKFQQYVTGKATPLPAVELFTQAQERTIATPPPSFIKEHFALAEEVEALRQQLVDAHAQTHTVTAQLDRIHSSRGYRAARKIYSVKQKISRKLKK
jgi:hypothetical protein